MRTVHTVLLLISGITLTGCVRGDDRFALTVKVIRQVEESSPLRLTVELRNISAQSQRVVMLTNLFEGNVYLRNPAGEVYEFTESNYLRMLLTGFFLRPTLEIAPGASHCFEHSSAEFVDWRRPRPSGGGESIVDLFRPPAAEFQPASLAVEFQPGCTIWCTLEVHQWKSLGGDRTTAEATALLVTEAIPYPAR